MLVRAALLALLLASAALLAANLSCASVEGGVVDGRLKACPDSPNCVCSQDERESHHIAPLDLGPDPEAGWAALLELMEDWPRATFGARREGYAHVVAVTPILRFRDDLELLFDREAGVAHVRSASRVGYSDLGANRRRVERIRDALAKRLSRS